LSFFSQDRELRDRTTAGNRGMESRAMLPARYRKLVLPERAGSSGTACEPPTLPGSRTPVT
jgi:hypothetical protein